ncbi:acetyltransferase [Azorhizobium doebereinerae]|uniref:acetyltransferase n=1 Tax=Azorhizobium doebereinerae TaxID=281091 RepID=UPI00041370F7|nr:acetyltransferase [Azorhizobium doebereinerae]
MGRPLEARRTRPRDGGPSFPLRSRLARAAFALAWALLARWTPPQMHGWRRLLLRAFGARLDATAKVYPTARIWYPPHLAMAAHACLAPDVDCYCMAQVTLGPYALVSQGAHLCAGSHDIDDPDFQLIARPITIGAEAWIAAGAFVGPGVVVGEGAVLGANAVTVKDLEPWHVYAGNPARYIRMRMRQDGRGEAPE